MLAPALDLRVERLRHKAARKSDLRRQELFERALAVCHRVQLVLPKRRGVGIDEIVGQGIDEEVSRIGRIEQLLLALRRKEAPLDEIVDDRRTRRLRADAIDVLEAFLRLGIEHVLVDLLHALQERRRREARRRLRRTLLERAACVRHGVALLQWRQDAAFFFLAVCVARISFFARALLRRAVNGTPARLNLAPPIHGERLAVIVESRTRLLINMLGIELRDERLRDQAVDVLLRLRERPDPRTHARRNDRMVRRHLLVVPCAALDLRVRAARPMRQSRIVAVPEIREDRRRILSLVQRQIF